jgi:hypothetical protein
LKVVEERERKSKGRGKGKARETESGEVKNEVEDLNEHAAC